MTARQLLARTVSLGLIALAPVYAVTMRDRPQHSATATAAKAPQPAPTVQRHQPAREIPPTAHTAAARPLAERRPASRASRSRPRTPTDVLLSSTAYCLTGTMADGTRVDAYPPFTVAAGNRWALGTRLRVVELGITVTIRDRIGYGSDLDFAIPGDCHRAEAYGRRAVHVLPAS